MSKNHEELDQEFEFTPELRAQAKKWIDEKIPKDPPCDLCANTSWIIGDIIVENSSFKDSAPGIVLASLPLFCDKCGNTKFLNAVSLGLLPEAVRQNQMDEEDVNGD